jgi:hypothetical protein
MEKDVLYHSYVRVFDKINERTYNKTVGRISLAVTGFEEEKSSKIESILKNAFEKIEEILKSGYETVPKEN